MILGTCNHIEATIQLAMSGMKLVIATPLEELGGSAALKRCVPLIKGFFSKAGLKQEVAKAGLKQEALLSHLCGAALHCTLSAPCYCRLLALRVRLHGS